MCHTLQWMQHTACNTLEWHTTYPEMVVPHSLTMRSMIHALQSHTNYAVLNVPLWWYTFPKLDVSHSHTTHPQRDVPHGFMCPSLQWHSNHTDTDVPHLNCHHTLPTTLSELFAPTYKTDGGTKNNVNICNHSCVHFLDWFYVLTRTSHYSPATINLLMIGKTSGMTWQMSCQMICQMS